VVLDLVALPEGSSESDHTESLEHVLPDTENRRYIHPVRVHLYVQKTQDEAIVNGRVKAHAKATCVRCLNEIPIDIDEPFRVVVNLVGDGEKTEDTGDDDFVQIERREPSWDFTQLMRETILLAIPDNPLCRSDCAGLCAGCGRNLNLEECVCQNERNEGPFADLKAKLEAARSGARKRGR